MIGVTRQERPGTAQDPNCGQSRLPRVEPSCCHVTVVLNGQIVADTKRALRVVEDGVPPVYYIPPGDFRRTCFRPTSEETFCEWKGIARHFDIVVGDRVASDAAWSFPEPSCRYAVLRDHVAVRPERVDGVFIDDERLGS
ncbi:MAG TPA: DUF427 domain-containing protein [Candidatus Binatia bacterium]|nr:DUF427 domain-containing protein [Candidatus Binatia bacterium]